MGQDEPKNGAETGALAMPKGAQLKLKTLVLQQVLLQKTDDEHALTMLELIEELAARGLTAERKSIYDDMDALRACGVDVQCSKGKQGGWFVGSRSFELPELKLLVDAVQASRFITTRKSDALIRKLESLTSEHQAQKLQRQVYLERRVKNMNESVYYAVDKLHTALAEGKTVTFRYFDYGLCGEKTFRRGGAPYAVSPYGLVWESENYYLVGWEKAAAGVRHFRVDKMAELKIPKRQTDRRENPEGFDMAAYTNKHFCMFHGRDARVTLRCENDMSGVLLDRFGHGLCLEPDGEAHFTAEADVAVSPQFFAWLCGLGSRVELISPNWAVAELRAQLKEICGLYQGREKRHNL